MNIVKKLLKSVAVVAVVLFSTGLAEAQQKLGHIDFGEIISSTQEFKTAQEELKTLNDSKTKELQDMYAAYQEKQNEANEKLRNRSEANSQEVDSALQVLGTEIQDIESRINEVQRASQEELSKKEQELFEPIQKKVTEAINSVASEKGYTYVFDVSNGSIPYFQGGDDLTADVKTKLGVE